MKILFESYNDGHREIVIDGVRYWVDEFNRLREPTND